MEKTFHMLLYRAFHAQRNYLGPSITALGLGSGQPKLLAFLEENGPCQQRVLAEYFEIDPAAVCRMLDSLEKGGFIKRRAAENNRRAGRIEITEKGKQVNDLWKQHCRRMEEVMLEGFSAEEKHAFADYLSRAYQNLKDKGEPQR